MDDLAWRTSAAAAPPLQSAGRTIRAPRTSENAWSLWLGQLAPPALALQDLLDPAARLVVVAPHPDDELLACGGLMGAHADRGGRCQVVAVSDGEASHPGSTRWTPARLRRARQRERQRGLRALQVRPAPTLRLQFPDGGVGSHADALAERLAGLLQPGDLVLSTWRRDGHPDHDATGAACARACAGVGACLIEAPVWMWHWAAPADPRVPWSQLRAFPLSPDLVARKQAAVDCHTSQREAGDGDAGPVLDAAIVSRVRRTREYLILPTGPADATPL